MHSSVNSAGRSLRSSLVLSRIHGVFPLPVSTVSSSSFLSGGASFPSIIRSSSISMITSSSSSIIQRSLSTAATNAPATNTTASSSSSGTASLPFNWQYDLTKYNRAIVRNLAPNFASHALRQHHQNTNSTSTSTTTTPKGTTTSTPSPSPSTIAIEQTVAETQHQSYVQVLKKCVKEVITIPSADDCPDSVFIEDTAIVVGKTALITRPGHPSRRKETEGTKQILQQLGYHVKEMIAPAVLDGGDVLFTGKEFFVGLSRRTNRQGIVALADTFPGFRITTVPLNTLLPTPKTNKKTKVVSNGTTVPILHLKSICSMIGPDVIAVSDNELGQAVAFYMQDYNGIPRAMRAAGQRYRFLLLPDVIATNNLFINGSIITPSSYLCPASYQIITDYATDEGFTIHQVDNSELAKADGALTCCSILLQ